MNDPGALTKLDRGERWSFTGRGWVFKEINTFLAGTGQTFLLAGGPGTGKSAIAHRLVQMSQEDCPPNSYPSLGPGFLFQAYFCRTNDPAGIRPSGFVASLSSDLGNAFEPCQETIREFGRRGGTNISVTVKARQASKGAHLTGIGTLNVTVGDGPSPTDAFLDLVAEPLRALERSQDHRPIVIVIDGLDEALAYAPDAESRTIPGLLGTILQASDALPPSVRFILTTRPDARVFRSLGKRCDLDLIKDAPPDVDDVSAYARSQFENSSPLRAKAEALAAKVAEASKGNFLYARYVVEHLIDHPKRVGDLDTLELPEDLEGIYREFLGRELARDGASWDDRYRPVLGILAVARGDGVTAKQIAGAAGLTRTQLGAPLRAMAQYLAGPDPDGPYQIYHQSFRDFLLTDSDYRVETQEANQALARYFLEECKDRWLACEDSYAIEHTAAHLAAAIPDAPRRKDQEDLAQQLTYLLTDLGYLERKAALLGIDEVLEDFRTGYDLLSTDSAAIDMYRVLDREAHNLRGWDANRWPVYFAQQVHNRAVDLGKLEVTEATRGRLSALQLPFFELRWRSGGESPALERLLIGHHRGISRLILASDGRRAISSSSDGTVRVWDTRIGRLLHQISARSAGPIALTPDGSVSLVAQEHRVTAWSVETGHIIGKIEHSSEISQICAGLNGQILLGADDGTVTVWDPEQELIRTMKAIHGSRIRELAISQDGTTAVSAADNQTFVIWDLKHRRLKKVLKRAPGTVLAIAADSMRALCCSSAGSANLWDIVQGRSERELPISGRVAMAAGGTRAISVSGAMDLTVRIWDLASGQQSHALNGHDHWLTTVAITADGTQAASGDTTGVIRVWNLTVSAPGRETLYRNWVRFVSVSADGSVGLSGSMDKLVKVWDMQTGTARTIRMSGTRGVSAILPDGRSFLCTRDRALILCNLNTGREQHTIVEDAGALLAISVGRDGNWVAWGGDKKSGMSTGAWDLRSHDPPLTMTPIGRVSSLSVAVDGGRLATAEEFAIRLWDLSSGECITQLRHRTPALSVALTEDGTRIVSGYQNGDVVVWDLQRHEKRFSTDRHADLVSTIAVSRDRDLAISGSRDRSLRAWCLETGMPFAMARMLGAISAACIADDGVTILAGGRPDTVYCLRLRNGGSRSRATVPPVDISSLTGRDFLL